MHIILYITALFSSVLAHEGHNDAATTLESFTFVPTCSYPSIPAPTASSHPSNHTLFKHLTPSAGNVSVYNSCPYNLTLWSVSQTTPTPEAIHLPAGYLYFETLRQPCEGCGVSLKISRNETMEAITQFEYAYQAETGVVSYDISLIDCVTDEGANGKTGKECPGWENGLLVTGGEGCKNFECGAGEECTREAFWDSTGGGVPPRGTCDKAKGIAFELCAGLRSVDL